MPEKQLMAVKGDEMGLAAVSKGNVSCRAGQCARCAPASRLGALALAKKGLALASRGWSDASCPGCPWGALGSAKPPVLQCWVLRRLLGVLAGGWRAWGRVGTSACPAAAVSGSQGTPHSPCWGGRSSRLPDTSKQQCWVPSLKPHSQNGEANLTVRWALQGGCLLPLRPPGACPQ